MTDSRALVRRRSVLRMATAGAATLAGAGVRTAEAAAPDKTLPTSRSLPDELAQALAQGKPLVVMVSLAGCPYCKIAREHYLAPMRVREGLAVVQVDMRSAAATVDFSGRATTHDALVHAWKVSVAPTVLFFGRDGQEIAERLEGGYLPDFYGAYLEDRLETARKRV